MQNIIFYLGLLLSLGLGIILGMIFMKRSKIHEEKKPEDKNTYIRGLKYIISNQPDKAIAELIKAVQVNSNTIEIYQDLGNLFRERGEVGRAIQIHQNLLLRPSLDNKLKFSSLMDLGLDYQKGGFIDRAIKIYQEVIQSDSNNLQAYQALEKLFEKEKNWAKAYETEKQIQKFPKIGGDVLRLAHLIVEIGKEYAQKNDYSQAVKYLKEAIALDKNCLEAYTALGNIYLDQNKIAKSINLFEKIIFSEQQFPFSVYKSLEKAYLQKGKYEKIESIYQEVLKLRPHDIRTRYILADYYYKKGLQSKAINELKEGLKTCPESLILRSALAEMLVRENHRDEALSEYQYLIEQVKKKSNYYYCQKCGYQSTNIQWKCPQCQEWDSFVFNQS